MHSYSPVQFYGCPDDSPGLGWLGLGSGYNSALSRRLPAIFTLVGSGCKPYAHMVVVAYATTGLLDLLHALF